jgi:hypothetical protein
VWILIFLCTIPIVVWFFVAVVQWFTKKKPLKRCLTTIIVLTLYCLFAFGWMKLFCGVPFYIAQRIEAPIPFSVQVLETIQDSSRDEEEEYHVIWLTPKQMDDFVHQIKTKNWKYGTISLYSLNQTLPAKQQGIISLPFLNDIQIWVNGIQQERIAF